MRAAGSSSGAHAQPLLLDEATELAGYLKTLTPNQIQKCMQVSPALALKTAEVTGIWTKDPAKQQAAIDCFLGDIYSGLQSSQWSKADRTYAHDTLRILSGLYGVLRALDGIHPYRLEMGYRLPDEPYKNLYQYWGNSIADTFDETSDIVDLSAVEYSKTITKILNKDRFIAPKFLTYDSKAGEPKFVVVHAKIARGAFANWMIVNRIDSREQLLGFNDLGYEYNAELSTPSQPVFVCSEFGGLGLSVRLSK